MADIRGVTDSSSDVMAGREDIHVETSAYKSAMSADHDILQSLPAAP